MSIDVYKKMAIEILASLNNKEHAVVAISSSNPVIDTVNVATKLSQAFFSMDLSATTVNARVEGDEGIGKREEVKINDKLKEVTFEKKSDSKMTSLGAKAAINEIKTGIDITVVAIDVISNSAPAIMFASCCDGIVLVERKNSSRTDNIDNAVEVINNICVKPIGFILV